MCPDTWEFGAKLASFSIIIAHSEGSNWPAGTLIVDLLYQKLLNNQKIEYPSPYKRGESRQPLIESDV